MSALTIPGRLSRDSTTHSAVSGKGSLSSDGHFLMWETEGLRARRDKAPWGNVQSFARDGTRVKVQWATEAWPGDQITQLVFETTLQEAMEMEKVARSMLAVENWRDAYVVDVHGPLTLSGSPTGTRCRRQSNDARLHDCSGGHLFWLYGAVSLDMPIL